MGRGEGRNTGHRRGERWDEQWNGRGERGKCKGEGGRSGRESDGVEGKEGRGWIRALAPRAALAARAVGEPVRVTEQVPSPGAPTTGP